MALNLKKKIGLPKILMIQIMAIYIIMITKVIVETGQTFLRQGLPPSLDIKLGVRWHQFMVLLTTNQIFESIRPGWITEIITEWLLEVSTCHARSEH